MRSVEDFFGTFGSTNLGTGGGEGSIWKFAPSFAPRVTPCLTIIGVDSVAVGLTLLSSVELLLGFAALLGIVEEWWFFSVECFSLG